MMHHQGNGNVMWMWEQLIELSKAQVTPGIRPKSRRVEEVMSRIQSRNKNEEKEGGSLNTAQEEGWLFLSTDGAILDMLLSLHPRC